MRIVNKTRWNTADLRRIVARIASEEVEPEKRKRLRVTFVPSRWHTSGLATLGGTWSRIRLINPSRKEWNADYALTVAVIIAHELAHNHGHRGERWMRSSVRYGMPRQLSDAEREEQRALYAWAMTPEYAVRPAAPKPKPAKTGDDAKLARVQTLIAKWARRAKAVATRLRKLRLRERYYQRKAAASEARSDVGARPEAEQ